jgi:hypothetical protein
MSIKRVANDTDSPIVDTLQDGSGNDIDISGFNKVEIHIQKPDGTSISDDDSGNVIVQDASNGEVKYDIQPGDLDQVGYYDYEWEVTFSDGGIETWPSDGTASISVRDELA